MSEADDVRRQIAVAEAAAAKAEAARPGRWGRAAAFLGGAWDRLDRVAAPIVRVSARVGVAGAKLAARVAVWASFAKDKGGRRTRFSPRRAAMSAAKVVLLCAVVPPLLGAFYYYGTWATYRDIYVPNSGVYMSQNFVRPNGAGQIVAPRDEIYTVLGKELDVDGTWQPVRFDIDVNWYFFFFRDSLRPDLAAAKMDSQSSFGVKCDFETTGIYTRLPRYWRLWFVKWLDLRAEIVDVIRCEEVAAMPRAFE